MLWLIEGQQHVCRLDVAVDESVSVGSVERAGKLARLTVRPVSGSSAPTTRQQLRQIGPVDEPHRDEQQSIVLPRLVDGDHVDVLDRRREPRLELEAFAEHGVLRALGRDQLDRNGTLERQLGRAVDDSHPPVTDRAASIR